MKKNFLYIINDLRKGGTNNCFYKLIINTNDKSDIICINKKEFYHDRLIAHGNNVYYIDSSTFLKFVKSLFRIFVVVKKGHKKIINCWLYKSCLIGFLVSIIFNDRKVIWNIRHGETTFKVGTIKKYLLIKSCAILSNYKNINVIYNSYYAERSHKRIGFNSKNINIVQNGFDINKFFYINQKEDFLREYKIKKDSFIICMIGRYHPIKNHKILFESISKISDKYPNIHLFLAGRGINKTNINLQKTIKFFNLENKTTLAGLLDDKSLIKCYSSCDLTILTSLSESFPNVIGESMACSTPCLSFDVGDCKQLIGKTGWVIKNKDIFYLIKNLCEVIEISKDKKKWEKIRKECQLRIKQHFNSKNEFKRYKNIYENLI